MYRITYLWHCEVAPIPSSPIIFINTRANIDPDGFGTKIVRVVQYLLNGYFTFQISEQIPVHDIRPRKQFLFCKFLSGLIPSHCTQSPPLESRFEKLDGTSKSAKTVSTSDAVGPGDHLYFSDEV
ncbi:hypothetical protein ACTXT7_010622 [Hymenolepis weldensis]